MMFQKHLLSASMLCAPEKGNGRGGKKTGMDALASLAQKGPTRPDYVPDDKWQEMTAEQKTAASDPANEAEVRKLFGTEKTEETPPTPSDVGERIAAIASDGDLPTTWRNLTDSLAAKVDDAARQQFATVVSKEQDAKAETVACVTAVVRLFGPGAESLPRFGTTAKESNNPDLFTYKKKTAKGTWSKNPGEGSVLELVALKAIVPQDVHNEIASIEKQIATLGKKPVVPFNWQTRLEVLREFRNKLLRKFINAVRLVQVLHEIAETMPKVGWAWIAVDGTTDVADDLSNLTRATSCVLLFAKGKDGQRGMSLPLAPSVIIEYRPRVALAGPDGGTLDELLASADPGESRETANEEEFKIEGFVEGDRFLRGVNDWLKKFFGPSATKTDSVAMINHLRSAQGSSTLALIFSIEEMLSEGVTSKPELRSLETTRRTELNRQMGGDANRQVKDQPDGAAKVA